MSAFQKFIPRHIFVNYKSCAFVVIKARVLASRIFYICFKTRVFLFVSYRIWGIFRFAVWDHGLIA